MSSLVEVLGIERCSKTKSGAGAELDIVRKSSDTTVVDLGLSGVSQRCALFSLFCLTTHLCERARVKLVLSSDFETNIGA